MPVTAKDWKLLDLLVRARIGTAYAGLLHGSRVRTAHRLERRGFVELEDNGYIRGEADFTGESERWTARITDAGVEAWRHWPREVCPECGTYFDDACATCEARSERG